MIARHRNPALLFAAAVIYLSGCTVGPKYVRPTSDVPSDFKEAGNWKPAQPNDEFTKGTWWKIYQDPQLDALEDQISVSNQTLKISQAQFAEARAAVKISRAGFFPTVTGGLSATHYSQSLNRPFLSTKTSYQDYVLPVDVSYEPDVWGRVRRTVEASRSEAQASAADLANVELSIRAELAFDYFTLRGLDAQKALLDSTVISYQKALDLTTTRYKGGLASAVDVAQAQTQLETTRALAIDVGVSRAAFEHAIAVLIGKPASEFSLPPMPLATPPPGIPPELPSELLERRPDIAAAERRVQEANAQIGIAKAAYFPLFSLTGTGGLESAAISTLIQGPSAFWTLGGAAAQTIFEAGARRGALNQAYALRNQAVATYQQTILTAFQEVEDNLAALRILQDEAHTEDAAVAAAQHSLALSITRYKGGIANYLEVTTAQSAALADEVTSVNILTRRMTSSVQLVKALGGGWNVSQIPRV
ncbi:MAG TPA: efflux transporter outer membrane subunit [Candidatus Limnocylindrales bacterium]|nr:efflux transporter outer membrane subunit [Candidatus Limnocylindrales bacterium]